MNSGAWRSFFMFGNRERQFEGPIPCGTVGVGNDIWAVHLLGATRKPGEWLLRLKVVGARAREREVSVRVAADASNSVTAQRVISAVRSWLSIRDRDAPTLLDLVN
jgi:hypothetical protein